MCSCCLQSATESQWLPNALSLQIAVSLKDTIQGQFSQSDPRLSALLKGKTAKAHVSSYEGLKCINFRLPAQLFHHYARQLPQWKTNAANCSRILVFLIKTSAKNCCTHKLLDYDQNLNSWVLLTVIDLDYWSKASQPTTCTVNLKRMTKNIYIYFDDIYGVFTQ